MIQCIPKFFVAEILTLLGDDYDPGECERIKQLKKIADVKKELIQVKQE